MDGAAPQPRSGLRATLAQLVQDALSMAVTRLELVAVELAEERERLQLRLALVFAGILLLHFGLMALGALIVAWFWDSHRFVALSCVSAISLASGGWLLRHARTIGQGEATPFAATLAELDRDRESLSRLLARATKHDASGEP